MITLEIWSQGGREMKDFGDDCRVVIGRRADADVYLPDDYVSWEHAILYRDQGGLVLEAMGVNPTWVDGSRAPDDAPCKVVTGTVISIRSFKIRVLDRREPTRDSDEVVLLRMSAAERDLYERTFAGIDFRTITLLPDRVTREGCEILRRSFEAAYAAVQETLGADQDLRRLVLARLFQRLALHRVSAEPALGISGVGPEGDIPLQVFLQDRDALDVLETILRDTRQAWERSQSEGKKTPLAETLLEAWPGFTKHIEAMLTEGKARELMREEFFRRIVNLAFGLGPLEDLLQNPATTEILIVGPQHIYVEMHGRLYATGDRFPSEQTTRRILERAVSREGRRIDVSQPLVDVQLADGSRLNAIIAPLSRSGDVLSIRKFRARPYTLEDLVENGTLSAELNRFLTACVHARKSVIIAGGTGSGKTTLLGVLAAQVDPAERIVLLEDTAEIRLPSEMHVVCLQTRPPNIEGKGEVTMRQLVRNALRMRPDRLIVGECRGPEVVDMLQAMNTGHPGSFTTVHANSTQEVISRIEMMVLQGADLPLPAIRRQIVGAVDLIVHVGRAGAGGRQVLEVAEVAEYDDRRDRVVVVPIFKRDPGETLRYHFAGWLPSFVMELESAGRFTVEEFLAS